MNAVLGLPIALAAEAEELLGKDSWELHPDREGPAVKRGRLHGGARYVAVRSGMGMENSLWAARWLSGQEVAVLVGQGVCGALDPALKSGDVIVADRVLEAAPESNSASWETDGAWTEAVYAAIKDTGLPVRRGSLLTNLQPVFSADEKTSLFRQHDALAVDMESAAIARAAGEAGLPFLIVRTVCDAADRNIPRSAMDIVARDGRVRPAALILTLLRNPSLIFSLLRMKKDYDAALASLKAAWRACAENI
jgi:nucleoside phosphorylase